MTIILTTTVNDISINNIEIENYLNLLFDSNARSREKFLHAVLSA